jgi:hypothetical protein
MNRTIKKLVPQLLKRTLSLFRKYIYFEDQLYYSLSPLYVLLTYVYEVFDQIPYLLISGARNSGKSRLADLFQGLCFHPINISQVTTAYLYRVIAEREGEATLIIDEADDLSHPRRYDLLSRILRSGYRRNGKVGCCVAAFEPVEFRTFCPKIIINQNGLGEPALESRTIPIHMSRSPRLLEKFRYSKARIEFKEVKDLIHSCLEPFKDLVSEQYDSFDAVVGLSNRDEEVWAPILIIAGVLDTFLGRPLVSDKILTLARRTMAVRRRNQLIGNRDAQILESTRAFVEQYRPLGDDGLYVGAEIRDFTKERWDLITLNTETVSRILKRHNVLKGTKRPRLLNSQTGSTTTVQKVCYMLDRERLSNLTSEYFDGGEG